MRTLPFMFSVAALFVLPTLLLADGTVEECVESERKLLKALEEQLDILQEQAKAAGSEPAEQGLEVSVSTGADGTVRFTVRSAGSNLETVLREVARRAGLSVEIAPLVSKESLEGRCSMHLQGKVLDDVLDILSGLCGQELTVGPNRLMVVPAVSRGGGSFEAYCVDKGLSVYRKALERYPRMPESITAHQRLASAYQDAKAWGAAASQWMALAEDFAGRKEAAEALLQAAEALGRAGQVQEAQRVLFRATSEYRDSEFASRAWLAMGELWVSQDRYDDAVAAYRNALEPPWGVHNESLVRVRLMRALLKKKEHAQAIILAETLRGDGQEAEIREEATFLAGRAYMECGQWEKAIERFLEVLSGFPEGRYLPEAYVALAEALRGKGAHLEALEAYHGAVKTFRSGELEDRCWHEIGSIYQELGLPQRALQAYRKVGADSVLVARAQLAVAGILLEQGAKEEALETFESLARLVDEVGLKAAAVLGVADALFEQEQYVQAAVWFEKGIELSRDPVAVERAFLRLGECYRKAGDLDRALLTFLRKTR